MYLDSIDTKYGECSIIEVSAYIRSGLVYLVGNLLLDTHGRLSHPHVLPPSNQHCFVIGELLFFASTLPLPARTGMRLCVVQRGKD